MFPAIQDFQAIKIKSLVLMPITIEELPKEN